MHYFVHLPASKKPIMFRFALAFVCIIPANLWCQTRFASSTGIIPQPVNITVNSGNFRLDKNTVLVARDEQDRFAASFFNDFLAANYHMKLRLSDREKKNCIVLSTKKFIQAPANGEHYLLTSRAGRVSVEGDSYAGTFRGVQTLIQLLPVKPAPSLLLPLVVVDDEPRFRYRGLHLDVGRHFFDVPYVKRYIDFIALHKLNYFHWHLTEDQGWRIEIKKYPNLTGVGAFRDGTIIGRYPGKGNDSLRYGGFYTQDEIRDVVAYAAARHIEVIPEIEMPGHATAALASYPYLGCTGGPYKVQQTWGVFKDVYCAGNDSVFAFLQDVLDEVMPLFPSQYIHIGGDECPKDSWKACPKCQQRIKENNLKDEHELQSYFVQRIEKYINSKGKKIIGWDEILEGGLAPNATVMSWRGEKGGIEATRMNHDAIMTPSSHLYLDHAETKKEDSVTIGGFVSLEKVYSYEPQSSQLDSAARQHILGAQANLWTEYVSNPRKVEYMLFPRLAAVSEMLWSPAASRDWKAFTKKLPAQLKRYELWKINYNKAFLSELKTPAL